MTSARLHLLALVALVPSITTPALSEESTPVLFEPATDWTLTERPDSCVISRNFAFGGSEVLLQLESFMPGPSFRLSIVTGAYRARDQKVRVGFLPGEPQSYETPVYVRLTDGRSGVKLSSGIGAGLPQPEEQASGVPSSLTAEQLLEREKVIDRLYLGDAFERDIVLHTGTMRPPMIILRMCQDSLVRRLGLDPADLRTVISPAQPKNPEAWARSVQQYYPAKMVNRQISAQLPLRLVIGEAGEVSSCFVLPEGQPEELVEVACRITMRQKFEPARNSAGRPIASLYSTRITYFAN